MKEDLIEESDNLKNINVNPLSYKIKDKTIKEIIKDFQENRKNKDFDIECVNNRLIISDKNIEFLAIIFLEPIEVEYRPLKEEDNSKLICDLKVYSTIQIDEMLKKIKTCQAIYYINGYEVSYFKNKIRLEAKSKISIYYSISPYKFIKDNFIINSSTQKIEKNSLSKYFGEYFKYDKIDKLNEFEYYISEERKELSENFNMLVYEPSIKTFKITGPSNEGKSTTLLYLSRTKNNVIYLNLKIINMLYFENRIQQCLEILLYEFGRLNFLDSKLENEFEHVFNQNIEQTPWIIIEKISEFLKKSQIKFVLILDQFKSSAVDSVFYEKIEKNLNDKFKLIISFSISDNLDFNSIANSIEINKGNPGFLSESTQNYFFYYSNLVNKNTIRQINNNNKNYKKYDLFDFSPKYMYLLDYYNVNYIETHIIEYLKSHCKSIGISNFNSYLFNFSKEIDVSYSFSDLYNFTKLIPMKYCYLEFEKGFFKIKYQFKYL